MQHATSKECSGYRLSVQAGTHQSGYTPVSVPASCQITLRAAAVHAARPVPSVKRLPSAVIFTGLIESMDSTLCVSLGVRRTGCLNRTPGLERDTVLTVIKWLRWECDWGNSLDGTIGVYKGPWVDVLEELTSIY